MSYQRTFDEPLLEGVYFLLKLLHKNRSSVRWGHGLKFFSELLNLCLSNKESLVVYLILCLCVKISKDI